MTAELPVAIRGDVEVLWDYNAMHHSVRSSEVGIGLGSHDSNVAVHAAELYHRGVFPLIVFTGANAPTTVERFRAAKPCTSERSPSNSASRPGASSSRRNRVPRLRISS